GSCRGCSGATGTAPVAGAGVDCPGATGTDGGDCGATGTAPGEAGAAGTWDMMPRSGLASGVVACRVAYHAMNSVMAKKLIPSHLVALVRKLAEPRAPNTVAEAPPPKPEPAEAPAPRCIRISAIIAIAIRTNRILRINSSIAAYSECLGGCGQRAAARTMARKSAATSEAPPMSPPSMSAWANSSAALAGFTLPPYRIGSESAILASRA